MTVLDRIRGMLEESGAKNYQLFIYDEHRKDNGTGSLQGFVCTITAETFDIEEVDGMKNWVEAAKIIISLNKEL